jgi:radical SAM superfamily enzyme YgiQ (UPF0313 family)
MSIGSMRKDLSEMTWDAVGITGLITNYSYVKDLIRYLKEFQPRAPIVVGGALGSSIPEIMLRKAGADFVVIGEGEETVVELFREIEKVMGYRDSFITETRGMAYLNQHDFYIETPARKPIKDIDTLPLPAYDLFDTDKYAMNPVGSSINPDKWKVNWEAEEKGYIMPLPKSMNLIGTRGCPWECAFCYHDFMGQGYRSRSPNKLMEEIVHLQNVYDIEFFLMASDLFAVNNKRVREFCAIAEWRNKYGSGRPFQWECSARVDTVTEDLLLRMKDAGCQMVCYGIESGNQAMLDRLDKGYKVEKAKETVKLSKKIFGEQPDCTFIVGTPGETRQTIQDSIDFCKQTELSPQAIFYLTPYPMTPLWRWMKTQGWFKTIDEEEEFVLKLSDNEQGENLLVNFTELYKVRYGLVGSGVVRLDTVWYGEVWFNNSSWLASSLTGGATYGAYTKG